jgi:glutaredoxin
VFFITQNSEPIVYTLENCPHCEALKAFLKSNKKKFVERDLSTAESLTELRINGIFVTEAPVLQKGDKFYTTTELFSSGKLDAKRINGLFSGA